jgi:WD40 repeat protein
MKKQTRREVDSLRAFAPSPDGQWLWAATGSDVHSLESAELKAGTSWSNLSTEGLASIYAIAAGGSWVVAGGRDGRYHILSSQGGLRTSGAGPGGPVSAVALAPDETFAVLGSQRGKLMLVRVPAGERLGELSAHEEGVEALAFDAEARLLATGSRDRSVRLWSRNGSSYEPVLALRSLTGTVTGLWLSPDGQRLGVLLEGESAVRLWNLAWLRERCGELGIGW